MRKKTICFVMIFVLAFTFCLSGGVAYAKTTEELQNELNSAMSEQQKYSEQLAEVQKQADAKQPEVDALNAEVAKANAKVAEIEAKIADKQQEMKEREDGLNARLRVMYKNGSVGFIDVLLGSRSISEFISNIEMIQTIYENDMDVLDTLEKEQEELQKIGEELKAEKAVLDQKKAELDAEMAKLKKLEQELEAAEEKFESYAAQLRSEIAAKVDYTSEYVGGAYVWPVPSNRTITSYFGWRIHPVLGYEKYHNGVDIAASSGAPVVAVASGTVILSEWYGGYGNCVIIDHGGGVVTTYGHFSQRNVSVGQQVTGGQVIGLAGSTGISSGPHLHIEFQVGGQTVDPLLYIK